MRLRAQSSADLDLPHAAQDPAQVQRRQRPFPSGNSSKRKSTSEHHAGLMAGTVGAQPNMSHHGLTASALEEAGLLQYLENDPRPTFAVDAMASHWGILRPVFCNSALANSGHLLNAVTGKHDMDASPAPSLAPHSGFQNWVRGQSESPAYLYHDVLWSCTTVNNKWKIVSGIPYHIADCAGEYCFDPSQPLVDDINRKITSSPFKLGQADGLGHWTPTVAAKGAVVEKSHAREQLPSESRARLAALVPDYASESDGGSPDRMRYDCTAPKCSKLTPHMEYFRNIDWESTPLGSMDTWAANLRQIVNIVMDDLNPAFLYWGRSHILIYNEAAVPLMGPYHPRVLGTNASVTQREYWGHFDPIVRHNVTTGRSVGHDHLPLFVRRNGILEETYFSFTFLPVIGKQGEVLGHYEQIVETSKEVIYQRRMNTMLIVGEQISLAHDLPTAWRRVVDVLETNDKDVPFALLYSVEDSSGQNNESLGTPPGDGVFHPKDCILRGTIGVPENHVAAPARCDLHYSYEGFIPFFREAMKSKQPMLLHVDDDSFPARLVAGIQWRGFGDACRSIVVYPITPTLSENVLGFVVAGLNPRTPYNDDYQQFIKVTGRILETSLASVVLLEEEVRARQRLEDQAARVHSQLTEQLKLSQREVERNEQKFQRFAERADVGIFILDKDGHYTYRNPAWFKIFQPAADDIQTKASWETFVEAEDLPRCEAAFAKLFSEQSGVSFDAFELKLKRHWRAPEEFLKEDPEHLKECKTWILCSAYPEFSEDGCVLEVVGCVTDVSRQKFSESLQRQRTVDAIEAKRQLENFIDTTSHEMRNPLSAILQCADGIIASHESYLESHTTTHQGRVESSSKLHEVLGSALDAAQTISQCAQHQKRIVDDVLTMSKLESNLLMITPVETQPAELASRAVKMFANEAKASRVSVSFQVEQSYYDVDLDWVLLDPTRLLQVLINLITNAIKFTRFEDRRDVTVSIGASLMEQPFSPHGIAYIRSATVESGSQASNWVVPEGYEQSEPVYLHLTVQDTGRGLSADEKDLIFMRFSQASPRTHIHYGGSGLGLFISRRLTEMQGGAIGFASKFKAGSTFSFYVKAARVPKAINPDVSKRSRLSIGLTTGLQRTSTIRNGGERQSAVSSENLSPTSPELDGPVVHVLVVEDNLVNQNVLAKQLRNLGCVVSVANHGGEAIDHIKTTKLWAEVAEGSELSVILMDWEMPVMDGLSCVCRIRELQKSEHIKDHIPVIAVTANARAEQISQAMEAGMDDVVSKPFRVPEVLDRMKSLIRDIPLRPK